MWEGVDQCVSIARGVCVHDSIVTGDGQVRYRLCGHCGRSFSRPLEPRRQITPPLAPSAICQHCGLVASVCKR